MLDNLVVELLQLSDVASRDWRPGIHDGSPEEAFVVAAIGDHLEGGRDRTRARPPTVIEADMVSIQARLSSWNEDPHSDLLWIATECGDVLLNPA